MCPSGIDEFPASDEGTLRDGMARIAELGSILLVHAELPAALQTPRGTGAGDFIRSRPPQAELEAIGEAIGIARDTGCRLHVVHVSTVQGMTLIQEAQLHGVDVSGETCPHYLLYAEEDLRALEGSASARLRSAAPAIGTTFCRWSPRARSRWLCPTTRRAPST